MKNLSLLDKFIAIINSILAALLFISFLSYYISPNSFSFMSFFSLALPALTIVNIIFIIYWLLKLKRQFLISTVILLLGFQYITKMYGFEEKQVLLSGDVKLMSYNVRMFNLYKWIDQDNIESKIYNFIEDKKPDILCIQEFDPAAKLGFKYPYKYIKTSNKNSHFGHAIFSNYKIINSGSLNFSNSSNNAIFIDILKGNDTVRIYNVHLESLSINPKEDYFNQKNSEILKTRVQNAFKKQANQASLIIEHQKKAKHRSIICGDFNNTAFSWVYNKLKDGKNDAFETAGKGFGKTFDYPFPTRIDFILTDEKIEVNNFKTYDVLLSDHYPIMARLQF